MGAVAPRSYQVATENGKILRRNRQHLLATSEETSNESSGDSDDGDDSGDAEAEIQLHPSSPGTSNITPVPRRSTRETVAPRRLEYNRNFEQIS